MPRDVGVIVVAAGEGLRFGGPTPKQYQLIGGVPMVLRALRPFVSHPDVAHVVLVLPPADALNPPAFLSEFASGVQEHSASLASALTLVPGGALRRDSVRAGLASLAGECEIALVHDGARPFVQRGVIDAVIRLAREGQGAVAAVPVSDTLKEAAVAGPDRVERTVDRARLWRAQTPQGFPREVLERAHRSAVANADATDDAALVEALGVPVRLVPDSIQNLKITTSDDLALAELLAKDSR